MNKIMYVKYNRDRKKNYQIKTCICEENGEKRVKKVPLTALAIDHVKMFTTNYELLKDMNKNVIYLEPKLEDNNVISYSYVEGKYFDNQIEKLYTNLEQLYEKLQEFSHLVYQFNDHYYCEAKKTDKFIEVFGDVDFVDSKWVKCGNIDLNINNVVFLKDKIYCFDYEWVFDFPIPVDYIKYRNICLFFYKYGMYFNNRTTLNDFLLRFGFSEQSILVYSEMENNFLRYISEPNYYLKNYTKYRIPIKQVIENERALQNIQQQQIQLLKEKEDKLVLLEEKNSNLEIQINEDKRTIEEKLIQLTDLESKLQQLSKENEERNILINDLNSMLSQKNEYISSFENSRIYKIYRFIRLNKLIQFIKKERN